MMPCEQVTIDCNQCLLEEICKTEKWGEADDYVMLEKEEAEGRR